MAAPTSPSPPPRPARAPQTPARPSWLPPPANTAPVANDDSLTATEDTSVTYAAVALLGNDTDADSNPLTIQSVAAVNGGSVTLNPDGSVTFTPLQNFNGPAAFDYVVSDGQGGTDTGRATVNVAAQNDAPVANPDFFSTAEDTPVSFSFASLVANDSDPDGDTITLVGAGPPQNGTFTSNGGIVTFTPNQDFVGDATLDYTINDGNGGTSVGRATITVSAVNDAPAGSDQTRTVAEDASFTFAATDFGFSDVDGGTLAAVVITTLPSDGRLLLSGAPVTAGQAISLADINAGNLTFAPDADEFGSPYGSFTFQVRDNGGTANGGADTDQSPNSFTFNVTSDGRIEGTENGETINGTPGPDIIDARGGDDTVNADGGNDVVNGGEGDDTLYGDAGNDTLNGDDGDDTLTGSTLGVRNDGSDILNGGAGNDRLVYQGNLSANNLGRQSEANGGSGTDVLVADFSSFNGNVFSVISDDPEGGSIGQYSDFLDENVAFTSIERFELIGSNFDDELTTGAGNDTISGGAGSDTLNGGDGNDTLNGNGAAGEFNTLNGDAGDDLLIYEGGGTSNNNGGAGFDTLQADFSNADARIITNNGFNVDPNGGFSGDYSDTVDENAGFTGIERFILTGSAFDDEFITGTGDDIVDGRGGNDFIDGGAGNDLLDGGAGNDTLVGGDGNDRLDGGEGVDQLDGGEGDDTFVVTPGDTVTDSGGNDTVETSSGNFTIANGSQIENVNNFTNAGATTNGNDGDNVIATGDGNDTINAGGGDDTVRASEGDDTINGGLGNDRLDGEGGNDTIFGNDGNDDIRGGTGDDVMFGGNGDDFFRLERESSGEASGTGSDVANGEAGDDAFFFGDQLDADDAVNGGTGNDQIGLQGDYSRGVRLGDISNVEAIILLAGDDARFDPNPPGLSQFNLSTSDSNVAAGQQLIIDANQLREGENVIFNGSRETDGNFFVFGGMGTDRYTGGSGDDVFLFRNSGFKADDQIDGRGGFDQLGLQGDYTRGNSVRFTNTTLTNVEGIVLLSATDNRFGRPNGTSNSYDLATADGNVAAGQRFTVDGGSLVAGERLIFDGTAETDGTFRIFGGQGNDDLTGGQGDDSIRARGGDDELQGNGGNDRLDGEGGNDTARFNGNRSGYTITEANGVTTVTDNDPDDGDDGTDTLTGIERLQFRDVAIDAREPVQLTGSDGTARGSFGSIQAAINESQDGDTITVASGTYTEQLTIDFRDNLSIVAAPGATVTVVSPATLFAESSNSDFFGSPVFAVIAVSDSDNFTLRGIDVDGNFSGDTTGGTLPFTGIALLRSSGSIDNVDISEIGRSPGSGGFGSQEGSSGLLIDGGAAVGGVQEAVSVTNSNISEFQKVGVLIDGVDITFTGNTITGIGATPLTGQNGIQISRSDGVISGNTISGLGFDQPEGDDTQATGIIAFEPTGPLAITGNTITGTGLGEDGAGNGIDLSDSRGQVFTVTGNTLTNLETGIRAVSFLGGTVGLDTNPVISGNSFNNNRIENIHVEPEQVDGGGTFTTTTPFNLTGSEGVDFLGGSAGDDTLNGLGGNDTFDGNGGRDTITGGPGDDRVLVNANEDGSDTVDLGTGNDVVLVTGAAGNIRLTFTSSGVGNGNPNDNSTPPAGSAFVNDGGLNVRFQAEDGSGALAGPVSRYDDEGITFVAGAGQTFDVRDTGGAERGELFEVVTLGTSGDDTLTAVQNDRPYYFNAGMGNDQIIGGTANDFLVGGAGNDTLNGAEGNDSFIGGAGNDQLDGGAGNDTAIFSGNFSNYTITTDANGVTTVRDNRTGSNDGTDTLVSIERLQFADVLIDASPPVNAGSDVFTESLMNATPATPDPIVMPDFIV